MMLRNDLLHSKLFFVFKVSPVFVGPISHAQNVPIVSQVLAEGMGRLLVDGSPGNDFVDGAKPRAAWLHRTLAEKTRGLTWRVDSKDGEIVVPKPGWVLKGTEGEKSPRLMAKNGVWILVET